MNTLVYVESPYQLENAVSFLNEEKVNGKVTIVIRDNSNLAQFKQFEKLIQKLELKEVITLNLPSAGFSKFLFYPFALGLVLLKALKTSNVLIGDARSVIASPLMKVLELSNKKVVLVDDGLYMLYYIKSLFNKRYTIYSSLPLSEIVEKNSNTLLFKSCKINKVEPLNNLSMNVNFIGMKISEIGFISEKLYLDYLKKVQCKFNGYNFYYFPHRGESIIKLNKIQSLGYKITKPETSIESFFKKECAYGGAYVTFFSTALYNLSQMISYADFYYIRIDDASFPSLQTKSVLECYNLFSQAKLQEMDF